LLAYISVKLTNFERRGDDVLFRWPCFIDVAVVPTFIITVAYLLSFLVFGHLPLLINPRSDFLTI